MRLDVVVVGELDDDADRPEDLLLDDLHVGLRLGEDGGLDEVALGTPPVTAEVDRGAGLLARVDVAHDTLEVRGRSGL